MKTISSRLPAILIPKTPDRVDARYRRHWKRLRCGLVPLASCLLLLLSCDIAPAGEGGYLFATFKGESPNGEQIYFALSRDGRSWTALNQSKPVLISQDGAKGVRDPYLLKTQDGKFILIATDLSIFLKRKEVGNGPETWKQVVESGSQSLAIWESADLVHWDGPRFVKVAPETAGCAWAPEAIYDSEAGDYLVFWASTTSDDKYKKQRIWATRTKDFKTFGEPFVYIEKPGSVIDTTIIRENGAYYRFSKDVARKAIIMESSPRLDGDWQEVTGFSLAGISGIEGPECFLLNSKNAGDEKTWCLIADAYLKSLGYQPYVTHDLAKGDFKPADGFSFPFKFRHGTVLPISDEEYTRLENAFPAGGTNP